MSVRVFQVRVDRLVHGTKGPVGQRLTNAGLSVQSRAKRLCPVDTGRLRSSIQTTRPTHSSPTTITVRIGSKVKYAKYVELGTRYMRPRPFLRSALALEFGQTTT